MSTEQQWQDWKQVKVYKKSDAPKKQPNPIVNNNVETHKRFNSGLNVAKIEQQADSEDVALKIPQVELSIALKIQQARTNKKWTQKELATKINEKANVINDYESGRAIPNQQIISKLERVLGVRLRS